MAVSCPPLPQPLPSSTSLPTAGRVSSGVSWLLQLWDGGGQGRAEQGPGSACGFPGAGSGPVPFGSKGEHAGSFSYMHQELHPPAWSLAAPRAQLTEAGWVRAGDALAGAVAGRDKTAAGLRLWFPMER